MTDTISGSHGIVLIPDTRTINQVEVLASESLSMDMRTERPHVSLYHADLREMPVREVEKTLQSVRDALAYEPLVLTDLSVFGGKFIFWDIEISKPLRAAHLESLALSRYRPANGASSVDNLGLKLSPAEEHNVELYGHPFVRSSFRPHLTIGYYDRDMDAPEVDAPKDHVASVGRIGLYKLGSHGRILDEIVACPISIGRPAQEMGI